MKTLLLSRTLALGLASGTLLMADVAAQTPLPPAGGGVPRSAAANRMTPTRTTASAGTREIIAEGYGPVSINVSGDEATVQIAGMSLLVKPSQIQLDPRTEFKIPADAQKVRIFVKGDQLHAEADGKTVLSTPLPALIQ